MQKKKKITKQSKRRLIIFGIPCLILVAYFCVTFTSYVYNYISLRNEEKNLNNELSSLQEEKVQLKQEIQMLNDPDYIIRYAKEKFLYSTDGEYVIKLDEEEKKQEEEKNDSYLIYILLGASAIVVCFIIYKKKQK
ncbi:MAG: septum formation initiator family protein [Bacilli bacterium]|nr:septum formation initiator family protein [Bacilli bacterium]